MSKTSSTDYPGYFQKYIDQVPETELMQAFSQQSSLIIKILDGISESESELAYATGKWTIKEVLQHLIDCEWIFCYRALAFARGEKNNLPGFDENEYAANSNANKQNWSDLKQAFIQLRMATEILFKSFSPEALIATGIANNNSCSVSSIGFIIIGHSYHHLKIIETRYLNKADN